MIEQQIEVNDLISLSFARKGRGAKLNHGDLFVPECQSSPQLFLLKPCVGRLAQVASVLICDETAFIFSNSEPRVIGNSKSSDFIAKPAGALFGKQGWPVCVLRTEKR